MQVFKDIVNDTLKSPTGKWSRKSLTAFSAYHSALIYCAYDIYAHEAFRIEVFYALLGVGTGVLALTVVDKMKQFGGQNHE
jgi:hypothetical protein